MLELWELGGRDDCRFSTFSWRTRLALHHKGLPFAVHPVAVSDKAAIGFSGQSKVPILKHDGHVIPDSVGDRPLSGKRISRTADAIRWRGRANPHARLQRVGGS